jgi:hypothetical protein
MTMTPGFRQFALTAHVTFSVGWIGAVAAFLALAVAGLTSQDAQMVRAAYLAMDLTIRFVIVPLALASLLTGLAESLGTPWGLLRHYWVLVKFLLTVFATIILLIYMEPFSVMARVAADPSADPGVVRNASPRLHAALALLVLLVAAVLAVYKPRGMTPYGMHKQREQGDTGVEPGFELSTNTPRWVKVFGVIVVVLVLLIGIMRLGGGHGLGAHAPFGG